MAEKHDNLVAKYRGNLLRNGYNITKRSPFVDYRPDLCAVKKKEKLFAEIEIDQTLHSDHTLGQLISMYRYVRKSKNYNGVLVVPNNILPEARFLVQSVFGDINVRVIGM